MITDSSLMLDLLAVISTSVACYWLGTRIGWLQITWREEREFRRENAPRRPGFFVRIFRWIASGFAGIGNQISASMWDFNRSRDAAMFGWSPEIQSVSDRKSRVSYYQQQPARPSWPTLLQIADMAEGGEYHTIRTFDGRIVRTELTWDDAEDQIGYTAKSYVIP
ncbi:hypothetical protein SEA_FORZA_55 [Gordonia phage Forza]|uniref:Uncharacterized protein n=1 Tax=Gordonia phage Forza TaxID=2571247 RepID=A0A650EZF4_9CAUD|nr:hypothetical protein PP303_gp055 [Gordonia phage Forza]QEM41525.1 hypothetical protein SEA_BOOPY_56 [Gordonia phage Boopy]QGT55048.1 hypothetical protein SEA_FORZA_55 [Gordonia phage Forza]UXE04198.1 hypothetical protein SEA_BLUENGOLD_54 [Gordonia phage BlueNGold]WBF03837.1 hypothetical protein SEA_MAREELIH_54 [Gordonia phage Mareelih]